MEIPRLHPRIVAAEPIDEQVCLTTADEVLGPARPWPGRQNYRVGASAFSGRSGELGAAKDKPYKRRRLNNGRPLTGG